VVLGAKTRNTKGIAAYEKQYPCRECPRQGGTVRTIENAR